MRKKIIVLFFLICLSVIAKAQTIRFTLPSEANKKFFFLIPNGLKTDTIASGIINMVGSGQIVIPQKYQAALAMGMLVIPGIAPLNIIVEYKDFSFTQDAGQKMVFTNSEENSLLYDKRNEAMSKDNESSYAHFFLKTSGILYRMSKILAQHEQTTLFEKSSLKIEALNEVDIDKLYYSRFWYFVIDGLLKLSYGQDGFASDMIRLLDKTKSQEVYIALVQDLITITNQYGLDEAFDQIMLHVEESGKIEYPQGQIFDAFAMIKVRKGAAAPNIEGLSHPLGTTEHKFTLVIFHQPGCESCHEQLTRLNAEYNFFVDRAVRVISISGDMDTSSFPKESASFLWNDKLCDYTGFSGANFKNYGVIGTPILYLIDSKNVILGRFSSVSEVENALRGNILATFDR